jgi:hypothetical protein
MSRSVTTVGIADEVASAPNPVGQRSDQAMRFLRSGRGSSGHPTSFLKRSRVPPSFAAQTTRRFFQYAAVLFLGVALLCPLALSACDDSVLTLVTGRNPNDELAESLLILVREARTLGTDLDALDTAGAQARLRTMLKRWVDIEIRHGNLPGESPERFFLGGESLYKMVASALGIIHECMVQERFGAAHDHLEPLICYLSLIGTPANRPALRQLQIVEATLITSKPTIAGNPSWEERRRRFESELAQVPDLLPHEHESLAAAFRAFTVSCTDSKTGESPRLVLFREAVSAFQAVKTALLKRSSAPPTP